MYDLHVETNRLLAAITDADDKVRSAAIHELMHEMDDEIARALLDVASSDAAEDVREDVIVGLGPVLEEAGDDYFDDDFDLDPELGPAVSREMYETIGSELRAIYENESQPKLLRRRAFEVLTRDPQPWLPDAIREHFASEDPEWKMTAIFGMGHVAGFEKEIAGLVGSLTGPLLTEAVVAAGRMEVTAAAKRIRELATSNATERILRLAAIEALPFVDDDVDELLHDLADSEDDQIAMVADAALEELMLAGTIDDDEFGDDDFDDEDLDDEDDDEEDDNDRP